MKKSKNNNIILGYSFQFYVFGFSRSNGKIISIKISGLEKNVNVLKQLNIIENFLSMYAHRFTRYVFLGSEIKCHLTAFECLQ